MRIIDTFLNPNGRLSRARFWLAYIGLALTAALVAWVVFTAGSEQTRSVTLIALAVPLLWINLCLMVKRWHDRNRSGLWLLINLIPGIGQMWTLVECGFIAGTPGGNKYGPSPMKAGPRAASFGSDIPEDMADPSGAIYVTPDHT